jgi:hypothetical protein
MLKWIKSPGKRSLPTMIEFRAGGGHFGEWIKGEWNEGKCKQNEQKWLGYSWENNKQGKQDKQVEPQNDQPSEKILFRPENDRPVGSSPSRKSKGQEDACKEIANDRHAPIIVESVLIQELKAGGKLFRVPVLRLTNDKIKYAEDLFMNPTDKKIILTTNLKGFFFDGLVELNKKSLCPVPESIIYYSSDVLDKFALSEDFFEFSEGKVREKILGTKLLEASQMNREDQRKIYKEVGDMSLIVCGYFSESVNKKIVDTHYYSQLGKMAYGHLNGVAPNFLDIPSFYHMFATCFESMTTLMNLMASKNRTGVENNLIFKKIMKGEASEKEMLVSGVLPELTKKVS